MKKIIYLITEERELRGYQDRYKCWCLNLRVNQFRFPEIGPEVWWQSGITHYTPKSAIDRYYEDCYDDSKKQEEDYV